MCFCVDKWQTQRSSLLFKGHLKSTPRHTLLTVLSSYPQAWKPWKGRNSGTALTVIMPVPAHSHQYFLSSSIYQMQLSHQIKFWVCLFHLHVTLGREEEKSNENYSFCNSSFKNREKFSPKQVSRGNYKRNWRLLPDKNTAKSSFHSLNLLALFLSPLLMVSILKDASFSLQIIQQRNTVKYCHWKAEWSKNSLLLWCMHILFVYQHVCPAIRGTMTHFSTEGAFSLYHHLPFIHTPSVFLQPELCSFSY